LDVINQWAYGVERRALQMATYRVSFALQEVDISIIILRKIV